MSSNRRLQPIFRPIRSEFMPLNIPWPKAIGIIAVTLIGLALALMLSEWTHEVEAPYTEAELTTLEQEYASQQTILVNIENQRIADKAESYADMPLSTTQTAAITFCKEHGITPEMDKEDLYGLLPESHIVSEEVMGLGPRLVLFCLTPMLIGALLFTEIKRTSIYKEIKRWYAWSKAQKSFQKDTIAYVENKTQSDYSDALNAIRFVQQSENR